MGKTTIEWTDFSFNPWIGCTNVSPACDHCYAEQRMDTRLHRVRWGAGQPRVRTKTWGDPKRWSAAHDAFFAQHGRRQRVFCASLADVFDNEVPTAWRVDLLRLIEATPNLDWLLLTKRIGNVNRLLDEAGSLMDEVLVWPKPNVWLGATLANREEMLRDAPKLKALPARVHFWSVEPMLGDLGQIPVELMPAWVIVGGESGPGARPVHPEWVARVRDQCADAGVPFLWKQWGEWMPESAMTLQQRMRDCGQYECLFVKLDGSTHWIDEQDRAAFDASDVRMVKVGKKAAGRQLDGRTHDGFPGEP